MTTLRYLLLPTSDDLAHELDRLGVPFVRAEAGTLTPSPIPSATLLTALATSDEARLRLALIPLLLVRPELAAIAPIVAEDLPSSGQLTLRCYYSAAMLLQQVHAERLQRLLEGFAPLPDYFSTLLGLAAVGTPAQRLTALAARHATLSGEAINWLGTYHHTTNRLLDHLEHRARWRS